VTKPTFADIAQTVAKHWNGLYSQAAPFIEQIEEWYGIDYPEAARGPQQRPRDQGIVSPDTDLTECLANARSYALPHLHQLAEALDHENASDLRKVITPSHEVIVVDVGCAAGALSLFVDQAGFAHYVGIDTNHWMRLLARATFNKTLNDLALVDALGTRAEIGQYGLLVERLQYSLAHSPGRGTAVQTVTSDRPSFELLDDIDSLVGWRTFVEQVSKNEDLQSPSARPITILVVMNHILFQLIDVPRTAQTALDHCRDLSGLSGVRAFLLSIEPGTLYKPDRLGTRGFDEMLGQRRLDVRRFSVRGVASYLTGGNRGEAAVRLISF